MDFTPENVANVVTEFYRKQGELNRDCHEWLKKCQVSREAWQIVWPLMDPVKSLNVQFVASTMLHYKISRCLNEVPETDVPMLKDNLIATLVKYVAAAGPAVIITRLQLTLGAFVANTVGSSWLTALEDLGSVFQPHNFPTIPQDQMLSLLVQIYAFVPEETQSLWQNSIRKGEAYRAIQNKGESMFSWLFNIVQTQQNPELIVGALKAMSSWMKMLCVCEWSQVKDLITTLVDLCSKSVISSNDAMCDVTLEIISGIIADSTTYQYPNLVLLILGKILPLKASLDTVLQRQDMELASSFYGMYVALADCHSKLIVEVCDVESIYNVSNPENRKNALALLEILLKCTGTPGFYPIDELVSTQTITVWYSFVEDIQSHQNETNNSKYVRIMQVFEWVYKSLAETLIRKSGYPDDDSDWSADEKEQFRMYRQDIGDCLTYCFDLRGWTMLNELVESAGKNVTLIEQDKLQYPKLWTEVEALLNGIRIVAENISDETDSLVLEPMKKAFEVIFRVLTLNREMPVPKVFQAALECISSCSLILQSFDGVAKNLLVFILDGLFAPEVASTSTLALKSLGCDCARQLAEFAPQILSSCKTALDGGKLSQNDCIRLVYCVGKFLPFLPPDQILNAVNEIFTPTMQALHTIANQSVKSDVKPQLVTILHILSTLCSSLDSSDSDDEEDEFPETETQGNDNNNTSQNLPSLQSKIQPLIPVIEQILPVLIPVAEKWANDEDVMDALFSILKHTISTIHTSSSMVLQYGIELILISYRLCPSPPATSLAKQILMMLGPENIRMQSQLLKQMDTLCAETMKRSRDNLDFAESYFNFVGLLIKNNTHLVNQSAINFDLLLPIAMEVLNFPEVHILKAAIYFLQITIDKAAILNASLVEYFRTNGLVLTQKVLLGIGIVPRSSVHHFADIFVSLSRCLAADSRKWLQEALAPPGFPSSHCTEDAKNKFYTKITKDRVSKKTMQDSIGEFAVACRNLSGSEYAAMTSKRI